MPTNKISIEFEVESNQDVPNDIMFNVVNNLFALGCCNAVHLSDDKKDIVKKHNIRAVYVIKPEDTK